MSTKMRETFNGTIRTIRGQLENKYNSVHEDILSKHKSQGKMKTISKKLESLKEAHTKQHGASSSEICKIEDESTKEVEKIEKEERQKIAKIRAVQDIKSGAYTAKVEELNKELDKLDPTIDCKKIPQKDMEELSLQSWENIKKSALEALKEARKTKEYKNMKTFERIRSDVTTAFDLAVNEKERRGLLIKLLQNDWRKVGVDLPAAEFQATDYGIKCKNGLLETTKLPPLLEEAK